MRGSSTSPISSMARSPSQAISLISTQPSARAGSGSSSRIVSRGTSEMNIRSISPGWTASPGSRSRRPGGERQHDLGIFGRAGGIVPQPHIPRRGVPSASRPSIVSVGPLIASSAIRPTTPAKRRSCANSRGRSRRRAADGRACPRSPRSARRARPHDGTRIDLQRVRRRGDYRCHHRAREIDGPEARIETLDEVDSCPRRRGPARMPWLPLDLLQTRRTALATWREERCRASGAPVPRGAVRLIATRTSRARALPPGFDPARAGRHEQFGSALADQ